MKLLDLLPHDELRICGQLYMRRFYLIRCRWFQVRLHETVRADEGRHLHSHPFSFVSVGLRGSYFEIRPSPGAEPRSRWYDAPWLLFRRAADQHRLLLAKGEVVWTLVFTGPVKRDALGRAVWGFATEDGFMPWWDYPIKAYDS